MAQVQHVGMFTTVTLWDDPASSSGSWIAPGAPDVQATRADLWPGSASGPGSMSSTWVAAPATHSREWAALVAPRERLRRRLQQQHDHRGPPRRSPA